MPQVWNKHLCLSNNLRSCHSRILAYTRTLRTSRSMGLGIFRSAQSLLCKARELNKGTLLFASSSV